MDCDSGRTEFDRSNMTVVLQNDPRLPCSPEVLDSLWISNSPHPRFHGDSGSCSNSMVNFGDNKGQFLVTDEKMEEKGIDNNGEDCHDVYFHKPEKKRRLKIEQVESLEKIFEVDNKLEPDRKVELANELGLQPRQVSIWFQNRRARFKNKQLEKDYGSLKASYDNLQSDHDRLLQERESLRNQVLQLKEKLKERSISYPDNHIIGSNSQKPESMEKPAPPVKTEDVSSAKSDVVDSESPHCVEGRNRWSSSSSQIEVAESYHVPPAEEELEEEEDNSLSKKKSLFEEAPCFPKVEEEVDYYSDPSANCCNWEFQVVEEQPASWFWPY